MSQSDVHLSRRGFLRATGAATTGLVLTFYVPELAVARAAVMTTVKAATTPVTNAFLRIGADDTITVMIAHAEMGQGIWTGLAMMIAEELDCDWSKVRPEHAPAAPVYAHTQWKIQGTGGSSTTNSEFERYRTVGATAKDMLIRAAAARWKVSPASCKVSNGVITSGANSLRFGQVAEEAMRLKPAATVKLKDPKEWKLLGTPVRRLDSPAKSTGTAVFGMDVSFPGLRTAVVARPPAFGSKLVKFDGAAALKVPGVEKVVPTANGVAVVAKHFWAAKLGRDALVIEWSKPEGAVNTEAQLAEYRKLVRTPGSIVLENGSVERGLGSAATRVEAEYEFPYLAHAPMEPLNCTVKVDGDHAEVWTGTQFQTNDQAVTARILGIKPENVKLNTTFLGGGFGRRGVPAADFVSEAVTVAKAAGVPVKTVWTREDDIRGGFYRPVYVHRIQVGLDAKGMPAAWDHVIAGQSILAGTPFEDKKVNYDRTSVEGIHNAPYFDAMRAKRVSLHTTKNSVPVLWWRSVGSTHTAFAMECMLDELAHAAGKDPLAYRLALLDKKPRFSAALQLAADKAGWGTPPPAGRARGLALHESFGSIIAEVAEVSIEQRRIRVHQVTCVVDCGSVINPLGVEAQMQGSIAFGLTAALYGELTLVDGKVQQSNFHDYQMLRMFEMPKVSVHVIQSGAPMGGIGEPATAPIAPAVANAVFALTKQRLRKLPLRLA